MWNSNRSVTLSLVCTKIAIALVCISAVCLPYLTARGCFSEHGFIPMKYVPLMIAIIIFCCIIAVFALFALDRLLTNIRRGDVFTKKNVGLLRSISWACFLVAIVLAAVGSIISFVFTLIAVAAAFFGLILRVVKNVIGAAVTLKDENDFTI
jgi:hypothetical protein